jgi:hypothetical protein
MKSKAHSGLVIAVCTVGVLVAFLLPRNGGTDPGLNAVKRDRQLAAFFAKHRQPHLLAGRWAITHVNLAVYFQDQADKREKSLFKAGRLTSFHLFCPNATVKGRRILGATYVSDYPVRWSIYDEGVSGYVRPQDVAHWQSAFCDITNRVAWGELRKFAGSNDDREFELPDGSVVGLEACQAWLNESIAAGWGVGASIVIRTGNVTYAASRKPREPGIGSAGSNTTITVESKTWFTDDRFPPTFPGPTKGRR